MNALKISNHKYLSDTVALKETIETGFINLAERLYKIRQDRIWDGEYDNLEEFLLELDLSLPTCSKLCSIYENWVLKGGVKVEALAGANWTSLYEFIPLLEKGNPKELVDELKLLTRADAIEKVRELKNPCSRHEWEDVHFRQCKKCFKREKVYQDN